MLWYIVFCARKINESHYENQDFGKRAAWLLCVAVDQEVKYDMQQIDMRQLLLGFPPSSPRRQLDSLPAVVSCVQQLRSAACEARRAQQRLI